MNKQLNDQDIVKVFFENEDYEHRVMRYFITIGSYGGSIFDYFKDKGINKVSIYGTGLIGLYLHLWATQEEFPIAKCMSENGMIIDGGSPGYLGPIDFESIAMIKDHDPDIPILLDRPVEQRILHILSTMSQKILNLMDVLQYAYFTNGLLNGLMRFKQTNPNIPVIICNGMAAYEVKNPSKNEIWLKKNSENFNLVRLKENPEYNQIISDTFRTHGYSDDYINALVWSLPTEKIRDYENRVDGFRVTTNTPKQIKGTIYIFGNSIVNGTGVDDANTTASFLQRYINDLFSDKPSFLVMNAANVGGDNLAPVASRIESIKMYDGDIIICQLFFPDHILEWCKSNFIICDLTPYFARPHDMGEVFWDCVHLNPIGYERIAKALFNTMLTSGLLRNNEVSQQINVIIPSDADQQENHEEDEGLIRYIQALKSYANHTEGKVGAIVMNCNPFTLGHRYLIESAAACVSWLYVFIVEEDSSEFSFADRIRLVKDGTVDISNMTIIPSGSYIISKTTFEAYFLKDEDKELIIDASKDVTIFAEKIAPALKITVRFAGEEPLCRVTQQYNATMTSILPRYGIEFVVMPRKEYNNEPISASRVRKLLKAGSFEELAEIVPKTTLVYLRNQYS